MSPEKGKWISQSQPQTLQGAVLLCYLDAALAVIYSLLLGIGLYFLVLLLLAVAAYGIANDRKWGFWGAVVLSCVALVGQLVFLVVGGSFGGVLNLLFAGVLVVLLLHPDSRRYAHAWFH